MMMEMMMMAWSITGDDICDYDDDNDGDGH